MLILKVSVDYLFWVVAEPGQVEDVDPRGKGFGRRFGAHDDNLRNGPCTPETTDRDPGLGKSPLGHSMLSKMKFKIE